MKNVLLFLTLVFTVNLNAQNKVITKDTKVLNSILEDKNGYWGFDFFYDGYPNDIPYKQKPPFDKGDYKKLASAASLSQKALKKVVEQCAFENWPAFLQTSKDDYILKFALRNLVVRTVLKFRTDKDDGEYRSYNECSIVYIEDKENTHAPKELLSDDGIGYFICVPTRIIQDLANPKFNYKSFTLNKPFKGGGFGNWDMKQQAYLFDMNHIEESFKNSEITISNKELKMVLGLSDVEFQMLKDLCDEKKRPDEFKTAQQIKDAQRNAFFIDVKAYELYKYGAIHLIYVPKNENYHLPQNMQPKSNEGWYFCTSSNVSTNKPDDFYIKNLRATTDASMAKYRIEQAEREAKMKEAAEAKAAWVAKNKYKGVMIYQFEKWNETNKTYDYSYKVISIFGPTNQDLLEIDRPLLDEKVGAKNLKVVYSNYHENMDEVQATKYITEKTGSHQFSVSVNYSYTIPDRPNTYSNNKISDIYKEINKLNKELIDGKSNEKIALIQRAVTDAFNTNNKTLNKSTKVKIVDILATDKYYTENKKFIGKVGVIDASLTENGDGTYYGIIQFTNEKYATIFYQVKIKVIE